jgi:DNA-binding NtrC family response regulator
MTDYPVLIVSSDIENRKTLETILTEDGLDTISFSSIEETQAAMATMPISIVFCEHRLADGSFKDLVEMAKRATPVVPVVVISPAGAWEEFKEAKRFGAFEVIPCPCHRSDVEWAAIIALRMWRQEVRHMNHQSLQ